MRSFDETVIWGSEDARRWSDGIDILMERSRGWFC